MRRVLLACYLVVVLSLAGGICAQQANPEQAGAEQALPQGKELDLEQEAETLFTQKCLECHERSDVDLEAPTMSLAKWMHVINWMREKAPGALSEEEATTARQEYVQRIRDQINEIEENLENLRTLLSQ